MSERRSELSIRAAAMSCLARCFESEAPYSELDDFLQKLRELGWGVSDVSAVAAAVLPLIGGPPTTIHLDPRAPTLSPGQPDVLLP
jgi:hypothetical protein